jgi:hypothetical protein
MAVNIKCERCGSDAFRRYVEVQDEQSGLALWETLIECWTCGIYRPGSAESSERAQEPVNHQA